MKGQQRQQQYQGKRIGKHVAAFLRLKAGYKWCTGCQAELELGKFGKDRSRGDGYAAYCLKCNSIKTQRATQRKQERGSKVA